MTSRTRMVAAVGALLVCSALVHATGVPVAHLNIHPYVNVGLVHPLVGEAIYRAGVHAIEVDLLGGERRS